MQFSGLVHSKISHFGPTESWNRRKFKPNVSRTWPAIWNKLCNCSCAPTTAWKNVKNHHNLLVVQNERFWCAQWKFIFKTLVTAWKVLNHFCAGVSLAVPSPKTSHIFLSAPALFESIEWTSPKNCIRHKFKGVRPSSCYQRRGVLYVGFQEKATTWTSRGRYDYCTTKSGGTC